MGRRGCQRRSFRIGVCGLALLAQGCWTGIVVESGRLHERVLHYDRIALANDRLFVDYTVDIGHPLDELEPENRRTERRAASLAISDFDAEPARPVETYPIESIAPDGGAGQPLPFRINGHAVHPNTKTLESADLQNPLADDASHADTKLVAQISSRGGRHRTLWICPFDVDLDAQTTSTEGITAALAKTCRGPFYSQALYRDSFAWWVYPATPFAFVIDIGLLPVQLLSLPPLLLLSD